MVMVYRGGSGRVRGTGGDIMKLIGVLILICIFGGIIAITSNLIGFLETFGLLFASLVATALIYLGIYLIMV